MSPCKTLKMLLLLYVNARLFPPICSWRVGANANYILYTKTRREKKFTRHHRCRSASILFVFKTKLKKKPTETHSAWSTAIFRVRDVSLRSRRSCTKRGIWWFRPGPSRWSMLVCKSCSRPVKLCETTVPVMI